MSGSDNPLYQQQQKQQGRQASAAQEQDTGCQCPSCGNSVSVTADICERCGHWLKEGKCCFCYAEVKPGQKFCRECGNPPLGVSCPQCNFFSHFDFCPKCDSPVSKRAKPYLEAMKQSAAFAELVQLSKQAEKSTPKESSTGQLDQLKEYLKKFEQPVDKKQTPGFSFNTENTDASEALENASKQEKIPQQQDNSAAELELMKKITLMQQQVFADNQSARMFYTSIKVLLPELVKTQGKQVTGWLCNYASVIHAAPHECSEPNLGGEWQFETYTTYDTVYSEH